MIPPAHANCAAALTENWTLHFLRVEGQLVLPIAGRDCRVMEHIKWRDMS